MKNKDLASIVERVQRNKKKYFEQLYAVTWETIYFLAYKMMGNEKDAEDVSQEIYLKMYDRIDQLKVPEAFNRWMNRMVMNTCTNALEKSKKPVVYVESDVSEQSDLDIEELNKEFLPLAAIDSKETRDMIGQTVSRLPEKQKEVVLLHYYEELSIPEISEILECSTGVVNNRLYFAKKSMESKIHLLQKKQNVKLYGITGAPVFVTSLKQYAEDVCTDSVKTDLWQRIGTGLNFGVLALAFGWIKKKLFTNHSSKSSLGTSVSGVSTVLTRAVAVLAVASVVVTSSALGNELLNHLDGKGGNPFTQGAQETGKQGEGDSILNQGNPGVDATDRSEKKDDSSDMTVTEETTIRSRGTSTSNVSQEEDGVGEVVKGSPIANISTLNSQIELPAGSVVTNNDGDRLYLSQFGSLDAESNIITQGMIARVPSAQVVYISVDEAGNKILPENSLITLPTGETTSYPGKIQIHGTYNYIKKLPVVVDVTEGDMTIVAQGDQLVLSVNGNERVVPKDTVIDVINTGHEDRIVLVDGCSVTFGVLEAELKTINQGNAVFATRNEIVENTYTTGKTLVYKTNGVKGQVATEVSSYTTQENPTPNLTNKGSAVSGTPEKKTNDIKFIVIGTINILSLGYLLFLGVKKRRERQRMKINKTVKKVCALGLTLLLMGGMTVPSAFAQMDENTLDLTTQPEPVIQPEVNPTEGTESVVPETPELLLPTPVGEPEATPEQPAGMQPVAPTVEPAESTGVSELVADETTLEAAFPDLAFRTYVATSVLKKTGYVDEIGKTEVLTTVDIGKIKALKSLTAPGAATSLEGLQHFTSLATLYCVGSSVTRLDVSMLVNLTYFDCRSSKLEELNVSNLTKLTYLDFSSCKIKEVNLDDLTALTVLDCSYQNVDMPKLGVSKLEKLITLECENSGIEELDVSNLKNLTELSCWQNKIKVLDVSNLTQLKLLNCRGNKIEILDVKNLTALTDLDCGFNELSILEVSGLTELKYLKCNDNKIAIIDIANLKKLKSIYVANNPVSNLSLAEELKPLLWSFCYSGTNIKVMDLEGFTNLYRLSVTKSVNANLSTTRFFDISGNKLYGDPYLLSISSDGAGSFSFDKALGYYIISPEKNASYAFCVPTFMPGDDTYPQTYTYPQSWEYKTITGGGIIDGEGNLFIGATLDNVNEDGSITLPVSSSIATPEGTFTFNDPATIKDGNITTEGIFEFAKNTVEVNPVTGKPVALIGGIKTTIEPGNGISTISTNGSEMSLPAGSKITDNAGDKTFLTEVGTVDFVGKPSDETSYLKVPKDKVGDIVTDEAGKITLPAGSSISDGNGKVETYPGKIVYNPADNTVTKLPYELDLSNGDLKITKNENGELVIHQGGQATTLPGDMVLTVKNTGDTDYKILVDGTGVEGGIKVNFGNITGNLEASNGSHVTVVGDVDGDITIDETSSVTVTGIVTGTITNKGGTFNITGDVKGDVTTTEGGQTKVDGNVTGNVTTDGPGSKTEVTGDVGGNVTTTNGGNTVVGGKVGGDVKTDGPGAKTDIGGDVTGTIKTINGGETTVKGEKLPYELDLAAGNITATENSDGKLVIKQGGVETILSGGTVLVVKNTGNTDNKITVDGTGRVDGITVNFGNVDGDLEALNGSNVTVNGNVKGDVAIDDTSTVKVTGIVEGNIINKGGTFNITGDVKGDVTTTEGGQTKVDGNVTGNVTTDGAGSKTEVTGDVGGNVTTTNGGKTIIGGKVNGDVKTDGKDSESKIGGDVDGKVTDTNGGKTTVDGDSHYALNTDKAYGLLDKVNGLDLSKYTDDSVKALNDAKATLMEILEPSGPQAFAILPDPSQASLDDAVAMLQVAYDGLVLKSQVVDPADPTQNGTNTNGGATQIQSTTSAKTGDDTNASVYVGLFLVGIGLLAGVVVVQRRRKAS